MQPTPLRRPRCISFILACFVIVLAVLIRFKIPEPVLILLTGVVGLVFFPGVK